jgi:hypothetical protein
VSGAGVLEWLRRSASAEAEVDTSQLAGVPLEVRVRGAREVIAAGGIGIEDRLVLLAVALWPAGGRHDPLRASPPASPPWPPAASGPAESRPCKECGEMFSPRVRRANYCGPRCQQRAYRHRARQRARQAM